MNLGVGPLWSQILIVNAMSIYLSFPLILLPLRTIEKVNKVLPFQWSAMIIKFITIADADADRVRTLSFTHPSLYKIEIAHEKKIILPL